MASVVVLPAPLPPSSPVIEPCASANEMPSTARVGLVDLHQLVDGDGRRWRLRAWARAFDESRRCGKAAASEARGERDRGMRFGHSQVERGEGVDYAL